jgi:hypothetical protein
MQIGSACDRRAKRNRETKQCYRDLRIHGILLAAPRDFAQNCLLVRPFEKVQNAA